MSDAGEQMEREVHGSPAVPEGHKTSAREIDDPRRGLPDDRGGDAEAAGGGQGSRTAAIAPAVPEGGERWPLFICRACGWRMASEQPDLSCERCGEPRSMIEEITVARVPDTEGEG
jgi:rubredoxin